MNIQDTLSALRELARDLPRTPDEQEDDFCMAGYLIGSCEPTLAPAAVHHLSAQFVRLRDAAEAKGSYPCPCCATRLEYDKHGGDGIHACPSCEVRSRRPR